MSPKKVVVVTGAGASAELEKDEVTIGMAIARHFASQGYMVVAADLALESVTRTQRWLENQGFVSTALVCDISQPQSCEQMAQQCMASHGRIDAIINNAGTGWQFVGRLLDMPNAAFDANLGVNLLGTLNVCRAALPYVKQSRGAIVNISSIASWLPQMWPDLAAYNLAKAALNFATRQVAVDIGPDGVRINAILPGIIDTPSNRRYLRETMGDDAAAFWRQRAEAVPLRSIGCVDDVAAMCVFLVSPEARYVTGQLIAVDGGLSC